MAYKSVNILTLFIAGPSLITVFSRYNILVQAMFTLQRRIS